MTYLSLLCLSTYFWNEITHLARKFNGNHFKCFSIIVAALRVCLASFVVELASSNQVAIVQGAGTAYEQPGLTNQLMWVSLDTVMLQIQVDASAPIQLQGVSVSQGFSVLMVHESQLHA